LTTKNSITSTTTERLSHPQKTVSEPSERSGCLNAFIVLVKIIFFGFVGIFALLVIAALCALLFAGAAMMPLKALFVDAGMETNLLIFLLF